MLPKHLPDWADDAVRKYFEFRNIYTVLHFWEQDNTIFAIVQRVQGGIYCLKINRIVNVQTEIPFGLLEVSNLIYQ